MKISIHKIQEPELEFGNNIVQPYIKDALLNGCGPYESNFYSEIKTIQLGVVGLQPEVDKVLPWIKSLHNTLIHDETNALRFKEFSGAEQILRCKFTVDKRHIKIVNSNKYSEYFLLSAQEKFQKLLDLYVETIKTLFTDNKPDCIIVCFSEDLAGLSIANPRLSYEERLLLEKLQEEDESGQYEMFEMTSEKKKLAEELLPQAEELLYRKFHRALKAKTMNLHNSVPIQVVRERTYIPDSSSQSPSTIAWNIGLGIYYKAGNIPWRLHNISAQTCFVGISFHYLKKRSGDVMYASVAQAFSSSGEGFALKGATIPKDQKINKQPYLKKEQAEELIKSILTYYENHNGEPPTKVVIHKTSRYQDSELEGFNSILKDKVSKSQYVWMIPSGLRLLRKGFDPPERGVLAKIENQDFFLFTTGFVSKWKEYPGPHIPSPLEIGSSDPEEIENNAMEILALTKMNWNSAEGIGRHPITLSFARRVGIIMTELDEDESPNPLYKYYM